MKLNYCPSLHVASITWKLYFAHEKCKYISIHWAVFSAKIIEYDNIHFVKWCLPSHSASIYATYTPEQKKLCITKIWISFEPAAKFSGNFLLTCANDCESISCQFQKTITVTAHSSWFQILYCHPHEAPWSDTFVLRGFPFTLRQQKSMFYFLIWLVCNLRRHAVSVRLRLSSGHWDVRAWHFTQQSCSSFQFSPGYWPESAEALSCVFHCMWLSTFSPSACDIKVMRCRNQGYTPVQPLPNCLCHILKHSWVMCNQCKHLSQPFMGSTPFDPADPVCRPTSHAAGESPSNTNNLLSMLSQMKNALVSIIPTHCWNPF